MNKVSPYVKKIIKENNLNISNIKGSGPNGRIIKRDLDENLFKNIENSSTTEAKEFQPSEFRKIIAEKTTLTFKEVPHFYLRIESNIDKLIQLRKKINNSNNGIKISLNDLFIKAIGLAQKMNPKTCVSWNNRKIIKYKNTDVSFAVALEDGLIMPIIKDVNNKGLIEISKESKILIEKSINGKLKKEDYMGGTISLSNLGMYGISEFSAIINSPQSCILAIGSAKKQPVVVNNEIVQATILKSTLSADHRILDGSVAAKLLKDFNDILENPFEIWLASEDIKLN